MTADPAGTTLVYHDYSPASSTYQAPIGGAATGTLVTAMTNDATQTPRIATDGARVFFVSNKLLKSVPIGGGATTDLVTSQDPVWVINDGTRMYWYNRSDTSVWRMKKP